MKCPFTVCFIMSVTLVAACRKKCRVVITGQLDGRCNASITSISILHRCQIFTTLGPRSRVMAVNQTAFWTLPKAEGSTIPKAHSVHVVDVTASASLLAARSALQFTCQLPRIQPARILITVTSGCSYIVASFWHLLSFHSPPLFTP